MYGVLGIDDILYKSLLFYKKLGDSSTCSDWPGAYDLAPSDIFLI